MERAARCVRARWAPVRGTVVETSRCKRSPQTSRFEASLRSDGQDEWFPKTTDADSVRTCLGMTGFAAENLPVAGPRKHHGLFQGLPRVAYRRRWPLPPRPNGSGVGAWRTTRCRVSLPDMPYFCLRVPTGRRQDLAGGEKRGPGQHAAAALRAQRHPVAGAEQADPRADAAGPEGSRNIPTTRPCAKPGRSP